MHVCAAFAKTCKLKEFPKQPLLDVNCKPLRGEAEVLEKKKDVKQWFEIKFTFSKDGFQQTIPHDNIFHLQFSLSPSLFLYVCIL